MKTRLMPQSGKYSAIAFFFLAFLFNLSAQVQYEKRVEIELKDGFSQEELFEFKTQVFLMRSVSDFTDAPERTWKFEWYNKDLELVQKDEVLLSKRLHEDETFRDEEKIYTLFKDAKGNFAIITVDANSFKLTKVEGVIPPKSRIKDMAVSGDYAYFNGAIRREPYLFAVNWKTGKQKPIVISIPGYSSKEISLKKFQLLPKTAEVIVYVNARISRRDHDIYLIKLDEQGNKKVIFNLTENIEENIITSSALNVKNGSYVFTGTYANDSRFTSEGIYFCKSKDAEIEFIEFYKFLDLDNFLSYLPEKRQEKIERKKKRKEARGKDYDLNYRIAAHEIIEREDGYILLGEAFYPTYREDPYTTTTMVNGVSQTVTNYRSVFDGYRYTHAIITKFDFDGKLVWDQTFELWPTYKPYVVKKFVTIQEDDQQSLKMIFASRDRLVTEVVDNNGEIVEELKSEPIETGHEGDRTKWSISNIDHWYGNTFIVYGSQKIKNKTDDKVDKKRKVYFISKVRFE